MLPAAQPAWAAEVGWALQGSKGSPAPDPDYVIDGLSGGLPEPAQHVGEVEPAAPLNVTQRLRKGAVYWVAQLTLPTFPLSLGPLVKALLPQESVSGSGPYDHVFVPDENEVWLSIFTRRPGGLYERFSDGLVESITFDCASGQPVSSVVVTQGLVPEVLGSAYTPGTTQSVTSGAWVHYLGGTLLLDVDATPATTDLSATIEAATVRINRPLALVSTADSHVPQGFRRGPYSLDLSFRLTWQDYGAYRASYFGSTSGSSASASIVYGSIDLTFLGYVSGGTRHLRLQVPRAALLVRGAPQPEPRGSLDLLIEGKAVRPNSGAMVSVTLRNQKPSAY